jgi:hypothetical protein
MSTELAIIRRAREIISDPEHWTQCAAARDAEGNEVSPLSSSAVCFCAIGSLERATDEVHPRKEHPTTNWNALVRAKNIIYDMAAHRGIVEVNDIEGHAAVLSLFDKALAQEAA